MSENKEVIKLINKYGDLGGLYPYEWSKVTTTRDFATNKLVYKIRDGTKHLDLSRDEIFHVAGLCMDGVWGWRIMCAEK